MLLWLGARDASEGLLAGVLDENCFTHTQLARTAGMGVAYVTTWTPAHSEIRSPPTYTSPGTG